MIIEQIKNEQLETYRPVFINRQTGDQDEASYQVSLYPSEVISKQIEQSTAKTIVMYKKEKK